MFSSSLYSTLSLSIFLAASSCHGLQWEDVDVCWPLFANACERRAARGFLFPPVSLWCISVGGALNSLPKTLQQRAYSAFGLNIAKSDHSGETHTTLEHVVGFVAVNGPRVRRAKNTPIPEKPQQTRFPEGQSASPGGDSLPGQIGRLRSRRAYITGRRGEPDV